MIKYYGYKNKYNYTIQQIRIDYENKIYKLGQFIHLSKSETITRKAFFEKIEELQLLGFQKVEG